MKGPIQVMYTRKETEQELGPGVDYNLQRPTPSGIFSLARKVPHSKALHIQGFIAFQCSKSESVGDIEGFKHRRERHQDPIVSSRPI